MIIVAYEFVGCRKCNLSVTLLRSCMDDVAKKGKNHKIVFFATAKHHKTSVALICSLLHTQMWIAECKECNKDKMQKWKTFMAMKRGLSSKNGYKTSHMCAKAICIMEKDIPGCFPRPPQHNLTHSTTFSRFACLSGTHFPSPHNYLIYYHQLQSFASFPHAWIYI